MAIEMTESPVPESGIHGESRHEGDRLGLTEGLTIQNGSIIGDGSSEEEFSILGKGHGGMVNNNLDRVVGGNVENSQERGVQVRDMEDSPKHELLSWLALNSWLKLDSAYPS